MASLCETCDREVFFKCPWVLRGKPIDGWVAKFIRKKKGQLDTYKVIACPDFKAEEPTIKRCKMCGKELPPGRSKYCSRECSAQGTQARYRAEKGTKVCRVCGKELPKQKGKYCSVKCFNIGQSKLSEKRKRRR